MARGGRLRDALLAACIVAAVAPPALAVAGLVGLPPAGLFIIPDGGFGSLALGVPVGDCGGGACIWRGAGSAAGMLAGASGGSTLGGSWRAYAVLAVLPARVWVPLLLSIAALPLACALLGRRDTVDVAVGAAILFSTLSLTLTASILLPPTYLEGLEVPRVTLKGVSHDPSMMKAVLAYNLGGATLTGVAECTVAAAGQEYPCRGVAAGDTVVVGVPLEAYEALYAASTGEVSSLTLKLNATLDKGWVSGSYQLSVAWRRLNVSVEGWQVVVRNPNPVPVTLRGVTIQYITTTSPIPRLAGVDVLGDLQVPPAGSVTVEVKPGDWVAYVVFSYEFKPVGGTVVESVRVGG